MAPMTSNRTRLMLGCGGTALALSLTLAAEKAQAQAFQATESVVQGAATRIVTGTNSETIEVSTPTAVIDWTPTEDVNGDALDFLPTGATATFTNDIVNNPGADFAVLNRILPSTNGNITVFDGTVISRIIDGAGNAAPGGTVAFYSPTGILVGGNAAFDVGNLILTTLEPDTASFDAFTTAGGTLLLSAGDAQDGRIQIDPGAQILASAENSYFAAVAAEVQVLGTTNVNGSQAYVAGSLVNLRFSNGLFDIEVPIGTALAGQVMELNGDIGGPSSTGAGDNHLIYAVAKASSNPISMLFSGNLGFAPAASAGIVNGEIILSANYDVFGRTVEGDSIDNPGATFEQAPDPFAGPIPAADMRLEDFASTSSLLAITPDNVEATAVGGASSVDGDLLLVGRRSAGLTAFGQTFDITGDVLVTATNLGVVSSSLQDPTVINAQGGNAFIDAGPGGSITIGGGAVVNADAVGGAEDISFIAGTATAGSAVIAGSGGTVDISGNAFLSAQARGTNQASFLLAGATSTGGFGQITAFDGGSVAIGNNVSINTSSFGVDVDISSPSTPSDAVAGDALINISGSDGGTISIGGDAQLRADAFGGHANSTGPGGLGSGGSAGLVIDSPDTITIGGGLGLQANGTGGDNFGPGTGGEGRGGSARAFLPNGGTLDIVGGLNMRANAVGGRGTTGGDAFGGAAGIEVVTGLATIGAPANASANATGGDADFGLGGNGGNAEGGLAFVQATGTLAASATIRVFGASATSTARGGRGGAGDSDFAPGRGGDATGGDFGTPNPVDPQFNNGAFVLAGGDNGNFVIDGGGDVGVDASAEGGEGGDGGIFRPGGEGGIGQGGLAQIGLALFGLDGSVAQGTFDIARAFVEADGVGGPGGNGDIVGTGGEGRGGFAAFTIRAGSASADVVEMFADGFGGDGELSGAGIGGAAGILGGFGGVLTMNQAEFFAEGLGGGGNTGGAGTGGEAFIDLQGLDVTINGDVELNASGQGGDSFAEAGGTGTGGRAFIGIDGTTTGTGTVTGNAAIIANGEGGEGGEGLPGGDGIGGEAFIRAQAGGTVTLGSAQVTASGLGVSGPSNGAGNGSGGRAFIESFDADSSVVVQNNTPGDFFDEFNRGAIVAAVGIGGDATGGSGVAGVGTGGEVELLALNGGSIALPADPAADPNSNAENGIVARGFGGGSVIEGGTAGQGIGGVGTITADGGTITSGAMTFSVFGVGGSGLDGTVDTFGGEGLGGVRAIEVLNGGEITAEFSGGISGGLGGDGTGVGTGGDASGGTTLVDVDGGTLNLVGRSVFVDQATGGSGLAGGTATGGAVDFLVNNGTVNFTANGAGEAIAIVGGDVFGGGGEEQGGSAAGAVVLVQITGSTVSGGAFEITASAFGGDAAGTGGIGGEATGGEALLVANPSTISLVGSNLVFAEAQGGAGDVGGNASGGFASVDLLDTDLTVAQDGQGVSELVISAFTRGGGGQQAGDAVGGFAQVLLNGSSLTLDDLILVSAGDAATTVTGGTGGSASGGVIEAIIEANSTLDATNFNFDARAATNAGGDTFGGEALLLVGSPTAGEQVNAGRIEMNANAEGGANNIVGRFLVDVSSGQLVATDFLGTAAGDALGDFQESALRAIGGDFLVSGSLAVDVFDSFIVEAGQGNLIGGPDVIDPTVAIDITSQGTITFLGDDDNAIDFGGLSMALTSRNIAIESGARIGAVTMDFTSLDTLNPAILGGTGTPGGVVTDEGYTLIAEELGRLEVGSFTFTQPVLPDAGTNDPDIILRDTTAFGSADPDGGVSDILIRTQGTGGIIRVDGLVEVVNAAPTDTFGLEAGERIEVVTPGGILIGDTDGLPTGELLLTANDIWVADAGLIGQLQDDPSFAGRNDDLAVAATGSDDPFGYLGAGRAEFVFGNSLLVRNTGSDTEQGGITVGDGGLFLFGSETANGDLDVFAYGRRQRSDGTFVLGSDFFSEVNFNINVGTTIYTDASEFNDCIINTRECPGGIVAPPPVTPPPVTPPSFEEDLTEVVAKTLNTTVIEEPAELPPEEIPLTEQESNDEFGVDFPGLIEAPLLSEDPLLDDPVASGGDSSAYGGGTAGAGLSGGPEGGDDE